MKIHALLACLLSVSVSVQAYPIHDGRITQLSIDTYEESFTVAINTADLKFEEEDRIHVHETLGVVCFLPILTDKTRLIAYRAWHMIFR